MGISNFFNKIKQNHWLMMIICCIVPLIILIVAVYIFGLSSKYLFWLVLLLCPIMHYFMMKDMHKGHSGENKDIKKDGRNKKCH